MKNKGLFVICAMLMVLLGASDALRGIFSPLFLGPYGFNEAQLGFIVSASYLGNLVCLLMGGVILDRIGPGKAMVAFVLALAASEVVLLFGSNYGFLLVGFFLSLGVSTLLNTTINLISDRFSGPKALMYLNALFFLQGIGTTGSQFLLSKVSSSPAAFNGTLIAFAVVLAPLAVALKKVGVPAPEAVPGAVSESGAGKIRKGPLVILTLALAVYMIAEHGVTNYMMAYGTRHLGLPEGDVGNALALFSLGIMLGRLILAPAVDRVGAARMVFICLVVAGVTYAIVFIGGVLPAVFLSGLAVSVVYPTMVSLAKRYAPASMGARATTVVVSAASVADIAFNAVFGFAIESFGYGASMTVLVAAAVLSAALALPLAAESLSRKGKA